MRYICLFFGFCFLSFFRNAFCQSISYLIPDIGTSGMNTYVEIIGPYNQTGNFGTDGIYSNNPGDAVRVVCANSADTNKIKIGPVAVSWDGRMISTQVFVMPWVVPNSSNWQSLSSAYRIPLQVVLNGSNFSNADTFYIVQPQPAIVTAGAGVLGSGGVWGIRSRRGAMLVDSLVLLSGSNVTVSVADCDLATAGNQGYFPFNLMSLGRVYIDNGALFSVTPAFDALGQVTDAGPGGGGGGTESFTNCAPCAGGINRGGDGYTGGGTEILCGEQPGSGTGSSPAACAVPATGGISLNGVPGGIGQTTCGVDQGGAGGGTGHPFGSSGALDGQAGGYGGGSGYGGAGGAGFASDGTTPGTVEYGKTNGNMELVPFAGGSGGGAGVAGNGTTRGGGGGGGGAAALHAWLNTPLLSSGNLLSNGANGVYGCGAYNGGGGGSGGGIMITGKLSSQGNAVVSVTGGTGGASPSGAPGGNGGAGRVRIDGPFISLPSVIPAPGAGSSSQYSGPSTDTTRFVPRSFTLTGTGNGQDIRIYLKPLTKSWQLYATISGYGTSWTQNIALPCPDTLFLLAAVQDVPSPSTGQYTAEPSWVFSQAAANILIVENALKANAGNNSIICPASCTTVGGIPTATGGVPPYTYSWLPSSGLNYPDSANPSACPVSSLTYLITVTDASGCFYSDSVTITVNAPLAPVTATSAETYYTMCDGTALVTASGGTLPYLYLWNNGETNSLLTGLCPGIYTVTVTDSIGCTVVLTDTVDAPGCFAPVNFNAWSQQGDPSQGTWNVQGGGSTVYQSQNGLPTFYVNPFDLINVRINGTITVSPGSGDDDLIGIVLGYNNPFGVNYYDYDTWLFDWKQGTQTANGYTAQEGSSLNYVNGNIPAASVWQYFWGHTNAPVFNVVATDYGATKGWAYSTSYQFTIIYTLSQLTIIVNGDTIFDITGCFEPGRFGFYNFSQPDVTYSNFSYQLSTDFKVATPVVCVNAPSQFTFVDTCVSNYNYNLLDTMYWDFGDGNKFVNANPNSTNVNPVHNYSSPGNYTVRLIVVDPIACRDTAYQSITVHRALADFTVPDTCFGIPLSFTDLSSATDTLAGWNWNFGDAITDTLQNPVHLYGNFGAYNAALIVTTNNGCKDTMIKPVQIYPLPTADFSVNVLCEYNPAVFTGNSIVFPGNIAVTLWDFGDGDTSMQKNPSHLYSDGNYTVTLGVITDNGCPDTVIKNIIVYPEPVSGFSFMSACVKDTIFFTDTSSIPSGTVDSWIWNFGDGSGTSFAQSPPYIYNNPGTYNVRLVVVSDKGCLDTAIVPVGVYPLPSADYSATEVCFTDATVFSDSSSTTGSAIASWLWDFGDANYSTSPNTNHVYASDGTFSVELKITTADGCSDSLSKTVTVNPLPVADFGVNNVCEENPAVFSDSSSVSNGNVTGWKWYFGDNDSSLVKNPDHRYYAGTYIVTFIATTAKGCTDTVQGGVEIYPEPSADFSVEPVCEKDTTEFADMSTVSTGGVSRWSWNFGDASPADTSENPLHVYANDQIYNVTLIIQTDKGCNDTITKPVAAYGIPTAFFTAMPVCRGISTQFTDNSGSGTDLIVQYLWDFGNGSTPGSGPDPVLLYDTAGIYNAEEIIFTDKGCTDTIALPVTVYPLPVIAFNVSDSNGCSPLTVKFTDNSFVPSVVGNDYIVNWIWDFGDNDFTNSGMQNPVHTYSNNGIATVTFSVKLDATSSNGCKNIGIKTGYIEVYPLPVAEFSAFPDSTTILFPNITFTDLSVLANDWKWYFDDGDSSSARDPKHQYKDTGRYDVQLLVLTTDSCPGQVMHRIYINPEIMVFIPNSFSPDNDGLNDVFKIFSIGVKELSLRIYDRWGDEIFRTNDMNTGWNGVANNGRNEAQQDVYVYMIEVKDVMDKKHFYIGHVTMVK